jgi:hypothetical protein
VKKRLPQPRPPVELLYVGVVIDRVEYRIGRQCAIWDGILQR